MSNETETPQYVIIRYGYADAEKIYDLAIAEDFDALLAMPHEVVTNPTQVGKFNPLGVEMLKPFGDFLWKNTSYETVNGLNVSNFAGTYDEENPVNICFRIK